MSGNGDRDDLLRSLDEAGRRAREERRAGDALEDAPGLRDVERVLEKVWAESRPRRARPWPLTFGLLAAAAAVIALMILRPEPPPIVPGPSHEVLGDNEVSIERPESPPGQWPDRVVCKGPKGLEYVLRIVEYADGVEGRELLPSRVIIAMEVELPAETTRAWPDTIKLQLKARNKEGEGQGFDEKIWERSR